MSDTRIAAVAGVLLTAKGYPAGPHDSWEQAAREVLAVADAVDPRTEALERIAALEDQGRDLGTGMGPDYWAGVGEAADIARAALAAVKA